MSDSQDFTTSQVDGPATDERPPWGILTAVAGLVAYVLVGGFIVAIWSLVSNEHKGDPTSIGDIVVGLIAAWIPFFGAAYWAAHKRPGGFAGQLGFSFRWRDIPYGLLFGVCGQIMVSLIYLPVRWIDAKTADSVSNVAKSDTAGAHGAYWALYIVFLGLLPPVFEELFFRGVTMRAIARKYGAIWGIVGSGIIFGLAHFEGIQTPALVAFGWLLAWRATTTGRIGETIMAHATFNTVTIIYLIASV